MDLIQSFLENPRGMLIFLLLALPGRFIALSAHEYAHAWMANRCGDPTARLMGRLTLNPLKHIDPIGLLMMLFVGIGWAKPVPVNPLNYRSYRRDDLKVSLAGVTMNFLLFVVSCVLMYAFVGIALSKIPKEWIFSTSERFITTYDGHRCLMDGDYYYYVSDLLANAAYCADILIAPTFGAAAGYAFEMLGYFVVVNIMLAIFNLLPIPPLDGYHVLNDLVLKKPLFASQKTMMIGSILMYALLFSDVLDKVLGAAQNFIFSNIGNLAGALFSALNLI